MSDFTSQLKSLLSHDVLANSDHSLEVNNLLDGQAYVRLCNVNPRMVPKGHTSEYAIVQAARTCTTLSSETLNLRNVEEDQKLVKYLARNKHTSPIEFCSVTYEVHVPKFVGIQLLRHRTGKFNEASQRYAAQPEIFYDPTHHQGAGLRRQARSNRQSSIDFKVEDLDADELSVHAQAVELASKGNQLLHSLYAVYDQLLELGVAREVARVYLPMSQYTKMCISFDLNNLFKFLTLRLASDAQRETREIAQAMYTLAKPFFPSSFESFDSERASHHK